MDAAGTGTATVAIAHATGAYTLSRSLQANPSAGGYTLRTQRLPDLECEPPLAVFETGTAWQLLPQKLYREADRATLLQTSFPLVDKDAIGVCSLPQLGAVGLYAFNAGVPTGVRTDNHLGELLLDAFAALDDQYLNLALAFFVEGCVWVLVRRDAQLVFFQATPVVSEADALFHLAALLAQYGLLPARCPVFVGGNLAGSGQLRRQLAIYFDLRDLAEALGERGATGAQLLLAYQRGLREQPLPTSS